MIARASLGARVACHACGAKYYTMNREGVRCPTCQADPSEAPALDLKALLKSGRKRTRKPRRDELRLRPVRDDEDDDDLDLLEDLDDDDL